VASVSTQHTKGTKGICSLPVTVTFKNVVGGLRAAGEPMKLNLRLGYDGPIQVWINDKPVCGDPNGTNPAVPDEEIVPLSLAQGKHRLTGAMDLREGLAWGFFLRFHRRDLTKAQVAKGNFAVPVCSLTE
jgi:hypothetical protein